MSGLQSKIPQRIALLGGSFNPAHAGHVHISKAALRQLGVQRVIWIVSPANPLKDTKTLAPFEQRYAYAQHLTRHHPRIGVSDVEQCHELRYTIDTLRHLTKVHPHHRFIWLMGGDNLASFHLWDHWQNIAALLPIAVMDRAPYAASVLSSPFARRYAQQRLHPRRLISATAPAWSFLFIPRHPESATRIRNSLGKKGVFVHNNN